jgi:hypothetical protein
MQAARSFKPLLLICQSARRQVPGHRNFYIAVPRLSVIQLRNWQRNFDFRQRQNITCACWLMCHCLSLSHGLNIGNYHGKHLPSPRSTMYRPWNPNTLYTKLQNKKKISCFGINMLIFFVSISCIIQFPLMSDVMATRLYFLGPKVLLPGHKSSLYPLQKQLNILQSEIMSFCWVVGKLMRGASFMEDEGERWAERDLLSCAWKMRLRCFPQESSALVRHIRFVIRPQCRTSQGIVTDRPFQRIKLLSLLLLQHRRSPRGDLTPLALTSDFSKQRRAGKVAVRLCSKTLLFWLTWVTQEKTCDAHIRKAHKTNP